MKKQTFTDVIAVWGRVEDIKPLLEGLEGVKITDSGMDSHDPCEPVVELSFNSWEVDALEIFRAISNPETGIGGLANSVRSSAERR